MLEYLLLLLSLVGSAVRDHEALVAENVLLRHQLAVLTRPTRKRPHLRTSDKLFWVVVRAFRRDWRRHLVLVRPESGIGWHRQAWRLFWRWRSRGPLGRPRLSAEVRELIVTMARDNPRGAVNGSAANCSSLGWPSPSARPSATDGADLPTHRARPGAPSWPTTSGACSGTEVL